MKLFISALVFIFTTSIASGQTTYGPGISAGTETWLALPTLNLSHTYYSGKVDLSFNGSGSLFIIAYFNYGFAASNEIKYKFLTFDTSFAFAHYPELETDDVPDPIGPYKQITFTPKVGVSFGDIKIKIGLSRILYSDFADGPAAYIGNFTNGILWSLDFQFTKFGN